MEFRRNIRALCGILPLLIAGLVGCESEGAPATALIVSVKSDLSDLARVEVATFPADADPSQDRPDEEQISSVSATLDDLPKSIVVLRGQNEEVLVAVRGLDRRGKPIAEVRTRAQFAKSKSLLLPVFLSEVCRAKLCDDEERETCYPVQADGIAAGACGPIPLSRSRDLDAVTKAGKEHDWEPPESVDAGADDERDGGRDSGRDATTVTDPMNNTPSGDAGRDAGLDGSVSDGGLDGGSQDAGGGADASGGMCAKPEISMATCGLSPSCGCAAGQTCRLTGPQSTGCGPIGTTPANSACASNGDCSAGHGCVGGRCSAYCQNDSDCGSGGICSNINNEGTPVPGANSCFVACNPSSGAPCGSGTLCATFTNLAVGGRTLNGNFCLRPLTDCPFKNNGRCDEPEGTRLCADGSDAPDCPPACTPTVPAGGTCDLVRQCGCPTGQTCQHAISATNTATASCRAVGAVAREGLCATNADCALGTSCFQGICRKYCSVPADCTNGMCQQIRSATSVDVPGLKLCMTDCNPTVATACPTGASCTTDLRRCVRPMNPCPFIGDGACDEPEGTRWCVDNTDTDCAGTTLP